MRLIDADKLVRCDGIILESELERAPAIKAIPVERIQETFDSICKYKHTDVKGMPYVCMFDIMDVFNAMINEYADNDSI